MKKLLLHRSANHRHHPNWKNVCSANISRVATNFQNHQNQVLENHVELGKVSWQWKTFAVQTLISTSFLNPNFLNISIRMRVNHGRPRYNFKII
jgi:hypothetical protein